MFTAELLKKCWENNIKVYQIHLGFKQAYDSFGCDMLNNT
jgi:hypothetical protein